MKHINIITNKVLTIGDGEDKFTFPVEPDALLNQLFDSETWGKSLLKTNADGSQEQDIEKQLLIAAVAKYGTEFLTKYAQHYQAIGGKKAIAPIDNAKPPEQANTSQTEAAPANPAAAMASKGRLVSGG